MDITLASVTTIVNELICGPYTAGMQKSHAWSEWTNQIWTFYISASGTESCPWCPDFSPHPPEKYSWPVRLGQRSYKPQTKYAGRMILSSSSQKYSFFLLSHAKLLTSIAYNYWAASHTEWQELALVIVRSPFSLFVCRLARVVVLARCGSAKSAVLSIDNRRKLCLFICFEQWVHKRSRFRHVPIARAQFTWRCIYHSLLMMIAFEVLTESDIWWLTTARRNFYQPVFCLYLPYDCAIMEALLPFHDV